MPSNITESMNKRLKMDEPEPVLKFAKIPRADGDTNVGPAKTPVRGSEHAAGLDLFSNVDMVVPAKGKALVTTGLQIALPDQCYGRIAPRSGLSSKNFIDVGAGVIDKDYRGEVKVLLFNFSNDDFKVTQGMKIAQLICERIFMPTLVECETLDETKRGSGGFGSTGTN